MINLEMFSCSGGMAEGFRRAGITFDLAIDFTPDHCDSYEANLGHRPIAMDVRDLLRLVTTGAMRLEVDLLVADPPCTPWSRAGKRLGTADERDMLQVTCDLIAALRPRRYLIGNVPGLDDHKNLPIVQRTIGGLAQHGYCTADFVRLDAADYGVPQHRVRPFWFGHRDGACVRWSAPTHGDPRGLHTHGLPGIEQLQPWVTCRDALGHLDAEQLGRPVTMRRREQNGKQLGSVADRPARVVGTSNLSDGNVIAVRHATTINLNGRHAPAELDAPAPTMGAKLRGQGAQVLVMEPHHPPSHIDEPAMTIRAGSGGGANRAMMLEGEVTSRPGLAPPGHHDEDFAIMSLPDAIILSERAAAILQGFPESWVFSGATKKARWSQIGQAMPPALAEAVARAIAAQDEAG